MATTRLLAVIGLVLSAASVSWQAFYGLRVSQARLRVEVRSLQSSEGAVVTVAVTNVGRLPTTVFSVAVCYGRRQWHYWLPERFARRLPRWLRRREPAATPLLLHRDGVSAVNPTLPRRLDVGDEMTFVMELASAVAGLRSAGEDRVYGLVGSTTAGTGVNPPLRLLAGRRGRRQP